MPSQQRREGPVGAYRRAIRIRARPGWVCSEMEDDVHHFRVRLQHADGVVLSADGEAIRAPWAVCPGALAPLRALSGQRLELIRRLDSSHRFEHCLHLFDLVLLATDHACDTAFERLYQIEADHDVAPPRITLWRDGEKRLSWRIDGAIIRESCYDGMKLSEMTARLETVEADAREEALVLRRASLISFVRNIDLDAAEGSKSFATVANCYAKQPQRRDLASRVVGSSRDFWANDAWPLSEQGDHGASFPGPD
jgi:hypothetical protein